MESGQKISIPTIACLSENQREDNQISLSPKLIQSLHDCIIFCDQVLIAINKPAGIAVQGGSKISYHIDGMLDCLKFNYQDRPKLVHRLDRNTSGVLLLARSAKTANILTKYFQNKNIQKVYFALVSGTLSSPQGKIDLPIAKHRSNGQEKMVIDHYGGKNTQTYYYRLAKNDNISLLALYPITGRTHQLRIHCETLRVPILGDTKYGGIHAVKYGLLKKMYLHAIAIKFPHPVTNKEIIIQSKLPQYFIDALKKFNFIKKYPIKFLADYHVFD